MATSYIWSGLAFMDLTFNSAVDRAGDALALYRRRIAIGGSFALPIAMMAIPALLIF
ncbi:MAG: hypothetical protein R2867_40740 [Caldilineaceae bacterium]